MTRFIPWMGYALAIALVALAGGCGTGPTRKGASSRVSPVGEDRNDVLFQAREAESPGNPVGARSNTPEEIGLRWAVTNALNHNPGIRAFRYELEARGALRQAAALYPNPELEGELENFGGSGSLSGLDGAESKALASQEILLAGKRRKRTRIAALDEDLAKWDYQTERLDVVTDTRVAYFDTLAAQARVALAEELVQRAEEVYETVREQVEAGEVSSIELQRARIPLERRRIGLQDARSGLESARQRLASQWGKQEADFSRVQGTLEETKPVPEMREMVSEIYENPDISRWVTELERSRARLQLEKARRIPDIKLKGGIKHDRRGRSQTTYIAGISIPLPLFDRNQYQVEAARARLSRARAAQEEVLSEVRAELETAYREVEAAHEEATRLEETSLPHARQAYESVREAYQAGKFSLLDVLQAQRTVFEVREQLLTARARYRKSISRMERLIGRSVSNRNQAQKTSDP